MKRLAAHGLIWYSCALPTPSATLPAWHPSAQMDKDNALYGNQCESHDRQIDTLFYQFWAPAEDEM
jgi:hypothetical protein